MSQCCRCVNGTCERKRCSCAKSWNSCVNCTPMKTDRCTNRLPLHTTNNATADILQTGLAPSTPLPAKTSPPASQSQSLPETSTTLATHIDTTSGDSPTPVPLLPEIEPAVLDPFSWGEGSASTGVPLSQPTPPPQPRPLQQEKKKEEEAGEVEAVSGTAVPFRPGEYRDTDVKNGASITVQCKLMSLTGMKEYDNKCYEELRCEDYQANRKGKTTGAGWLGGGLGGGLGGTSMGGGGAGLLQQQQSQAQNTLKQGGSLGAGAGLGGLGGGMGGLGGTGLGGGLGLGTSSAANTLEVLSKLTTLGLGAGGSLGGGLSGCLGTNAGLGGAGLGGGLGGGGLGVGGLTWSGLGGGGGLGGTSAAGLGAGQGLKLGAKTQSINISYQPASATATIPPDFGKPSVGVMSDVGDEAESKTKAFRHMNVKISSHLTKSNLQNLKYLFLAEGIPESDSEGATSGVDLFQLLEQKGVYTPHKVSVVKEALQALGREDLIEHILTFESVWRYEKHDGQGRQTLGAPPTQPTLLPQATPQTTHPPQPSLHQHREVRDKRDFRAHEEMLTETCWIPFGLQTHNVIPSDSTVVLYLVPGTEDCLENAIRLEVPGGVVKGPSLEIRTAVIACGPMFLPDTLLLASMVVYVDFKPESVSNSLILHLPDWRRKDGTTRSRRTVIRAVHDYDHSLKGYQFKVLPSPSGKQPESDSIYLGPHCCLYAAALEQDDLSSYYLTAYESREETTTTVQVVVTYKSPTWIAIIEKDYFYKIDNCKRIDQPRPFDFQQGQNEPFLKVSWQEQGSGELDWSVVIPGRDKIYRKDVKLEQTSPKDLELSVKCGIYSPAIKCEINFMTDPRYEREFHSVPLAVSGDIEGTKPVVFKCFTRQRKAIIQGIHTQPGNYIGDSPGFSLLPQHQPTAPVIVPRPAASAGVPLSHPTPPLQPRPLQQQEEQEKEKEGESEEQRPGVAAATEQDKQEKVKFAIITANQNERESARYFLGIRMSNYEINPYLQKELPKILKDGEAFRTAGISVEPAQLYPFSEYRTVDGTFYEYTYFYVKVCGVLGVLTECSSVGSHLPGTSGDTVNVLLETARDKQWDLQAVFLVGCCGCARHPEVDLGTVLIAKSIIPYSIKVTDNEWESRGAEYPINKNWVSLLEKQNGEENVSRELKVENLKSAPILSGDTLMANEQMAEALRKTVASGDNSVLGFEMEGAGAYKAISNWQSKLFNPKRPALLVVKGVSDFADSDKNAHAATAFFETTKEDVDKDSRQQICTVMSLMVVIRAIKAHWGL